MKVQTATIIIILLILIGIVTYLLWKRLVNVYVSHTKEGFQSRSEARMIDTPSEFYDPYYVERIDMAYYPENKNICRCSKLYKEVFHGHLPKNQTKVLLVNSHTGRFLDALCGISENVTAIAPYKILQEKAQHNAPKANVIFGDIRSDPKLFPKNTFTHIIFEERDYYEYSPEERKRILSHCKEWLRPEGILIVRVIDPNRFDPMIPTAVPLTGVNIQNYLKDRKMDSQVRFTDGSKIITHYTPIPSEHKSVFREDLYDPKGHHLRTHIHRWYVPPRDVILEEIMSLGFANVNESVQLDTCTFPGEQYDIFVNGVPKLSTKHESSD
jgi:SAM-dependent methyltransferase